MLRTLLGRRERMIESSIIAEYQAEGMHKMVLGLLRTRFGPIPADMRTALTSIYDHERLFRLNMVAAHCPDLNAFRRELAVGASAPPVSPGQNPSA
jgi:hypothetical protein